MTRSQRPTKSSARKSASAEPSGARGRRGRVEGVAVEEERRGRPREVELGELPARRGTVGRADDFRVGHASSLPAPPHVRLEGRRRLLHLAAHPRDLLQLADRLLGLGDPFRDCVDLGPISSGSWR